MHGSSNVT